MILSCRGEQYSRLDTLNIKIRPLFKEIWAEQVGCKILDGRTDGTAAAAAGQPPVLYWILFRCLDIQSKSDWMLVFWLMLVFDQALTLNSLEKIIL